jgi:hypothetical protein
LPRAERGADPRVQPNRRTKERLMTTTFSKRNKEKARQDKQREKLVDRQQRKEEKKNAPPREPGSDPDIDHIIPGPQPIEGVDTL